MKRFFFIFSLTLGIFSSWTFRASANEGEKRGTLIVTFKTDNKGERLERIRFWLKEEEGLKLSLYPKGQTFVDDVKEPSRRVVIENLAAGNYFIEFLIPNLDSYFEDVPVREVVVKEGEIVKINQQFKPLPTITSKPEKPLLPPPQSQPVEATGKLILSYEMPHVNSTENNLGFRLIDHWGKKSLHPIKGVDTEVSLKSGRMVMVQNLAPGTYLLEFFDDAEKPPLHTIPKVVISPKKTTSLHEIIPLRATELANVNAQEELQIRILANIPAARFILTRASDERTWQAEGREKTFTGLLPGEYLLVAETTDPFFVSPAPLPLILQGNEHKQVELAFQTLGKLKVLTNVSQASVSVFHNDFQEKINEKEVADGEATFFLPEGKYWLQFCSEEPNFRPPGLVEVVINPLESKEVFGYFEPLETAVEASEPW